MLTMMMVMMVMMWWMLVSAYLGSRCQFDQSTDVTRIKMCWHNLIGDRDGQYQAETRLEQQRPPRDSTNSLRCRKVQELDKYFRCPKGQTIGSQIDCLSNHSIQSSWALPTLHIHSQLWPCLLKTNLLFVFPHFPRLNVVDVIWYLWQRVVGRWEYLNAIWGW